MSRRDHVQTQNGSRVWWRTIDQIVLLQRISPLLLTLAAREGLELRARGNVRALRLLFRRLCHRKE
jgi:RNase P/RNase MRP subunit p30